MSEIRTSSRKMRVGKVVSDKMDKTVVVTVEDRVAHPTYKKIIGRTYRLKAHDENNECGIGEIATIPTAPAAQGAYYARDHILRTCLPMQDTFYKKPAKKAAP